MNSRERVRAALTFSGPDRPPRDLWALPAIQFFMKDELAAFRRRWPMDMALTDPWPAYHEALVASMSVPGPYTDDWGSGWVRGEPGVLGEVKRPALADWAALPAFRPPVHLFARRDRAHADRLCAGSDKFQISAITARPFERLQFLCGTEKVYMELAWDTAELRRTLAMVHEFYLRDIEWWCSTGVDGIFMMDDWGSNRGLLVDPAMWRAVFKPLYREYCDLIHRAGKFAFFHVDGNIESIFGDLVEVGMDAIMAQLFCMDIEELGRRYRGRVTFWGEVDRQRILPFGTPDDVRAAVARLRQALADPRGGIIAMCEWGKHNPLENIEAVYQAWFTE